MKSHKTTYNSLSGCLEAYFGDKHSARTSTPWKYREPEQGFRTIEFKSLPLRLNYMRRRVNTPLLRATAGQFRLVK